MSDILVRSPQQFDVVIKAAEAGQEIDISAMPPHPSQLSQDSDEDAACTTSPVHQNTTRAASARRLSSEKSSMDLSKPRNTDEDVPEINSGNGTY